MSDGNVPKSAAETAWHERRKAVMERTGAYGTVLVRGTTTDPPHTEETMAAVRVMMITQERDDALKHALAGGEDPMLSKGLRKGLIPVLRRAMLGGRGLLAADTRAAPVKTLSLHEYKARLDQMDE